MIHFLTVHYLMIDPSMSRSIDTQYTHTNNCHHYRRMCVHSLQIDAASGQGQGLTQDNTTTEGGMEVGEDDDIFDGPAGSDGNNSSGGAGNWSVRARCGTYLRRSGVLQRAVGLMLKLCPDPALFDKGNLPAVVAVWILCYNVLCCLRLLLISLFHT